jgi:hypothetical protein|tara:strand:- start:150 stop:344 length:195 start_codon:yes stop_codon:yes gene_type:complete
MLECCICHKQIKPKYLGKDNDGNDHYWEEGNNALPIHDGKCCDDCNVKIVVPARFTEIKLGGGT